MTLDLWYTLAYLAPDGRADYATARRACWRAPLREGGRSPADAARAVRDLERAAADREHRGRSFPIPDQARWMADRTGIDVDPGRIAAGIARALARAPVRLGPGVRPALAALRRAGIPLGLVSNILYEPPGAVRALLRRLGIARYFRAIVLSCELAWAKPSPRPFRAALRTMGARPAGAIHVGDLGSDLLGARRAGMTGVRLVGLARFRPRPRAPVRAPPGPIARVRSLPDLLDRLGLAAPVPVSRGRTARAPRGPRGGRPGRTRRPRPTPPRSPPGRRREARPPHGR